MTEHKMFYNMGISSQQSKDKATEKNTSLKVLDYVVILRRKKNIFSAIFFINYSKI